ncbi:aspartate aminotransferase family protein [Rhodococcus daqingensis]|uniref:Aspartate aminotransferase family protein n=1 Tax=Rhodococcus daqingensis TaxID=2479363 RepID=A0ABW2RXZ4_9NOCA
MNHVDRRQVVDDYRGYLGAGRARLAEFMSVPVEIEAHGAIVRTSDGRELIDCGGYAVFLLGHTHPAVVEAVSRQLHTNPLATRLLLDPLHAGAARALCGIAPEGLDKVFFTNSGAEATELAIKLARANGKTALMTMRRGFHGKTLGALSVTANDRYQSIFRPLFDVDVIDFGDLTALEQQLRQCAGRGALFVEPIQGEGGVVIPPPGYLSAVADLCAQFGALLIVDEIQTGLGRCGSMWAHQPEVSRPDILLVGKALSGGVVPVAAVLATDEVFRPIGDDPTLHTSTFGGSPLASAAVIATVNTLVADRIPEHAEEVGTRMLTGLREACRPWMDSLVREVRGRGLLIGIEFERPDLVAEVGSVLLSHGVIVNHSLNNHGVLRLTPPAVITRAEERAVVAAFEKALIEVSGTVS